MGSGRSGALAGRQQGGLDGITFTNIQVPGTIHMALTMMSGELFGGYSYRRGGSEHVWHGYVWVYGL